jgi:hypothetical protein
MKVREKRGHVRKNEKWWWKVIIIGVRCLKRGRWGQVRKSGVEGTVERRWCASVYDWLNCKVKKSDDKVECYKWK